MYVNTTHVNFYLLYLHINLTSFKKNGFSKRGILYASSSSRYYTTACHEDI